MQLIPWATTMGFEPDSRFLTKAITCEMSLDDALAAIDADVAAKIAE